MFREIVARTKNSINGNGMRQALVYGYPMIDVLVRESIQNSLDALPRGSNSLNMYYNTSSFSVSQFEKILGDHQYGLENRFEQYADLLEIRDVGTCGLDGPTIVSDEVEAGRWTKLVYSFAEKQNEAGKGGSWGYGKTCYYNAGVGFVVFYSKTIVDGKDVSRLAVSLIENTDDNKNRIIPEAKQGIVYWGAESQDNPGVSIPIEDEEEIDRILSCLGLKAFEKNETGTSIIIPFINFDRITRDTLEYMYESDIPSNDYIDFRYLVELSVQRWYFPILFDSPVDHSLRFFFNNELLSYDRIMPIFHVLKQLYEDTFGDSRKKVNVTESIEGTTPVAFFSTTRGSISDLSLPSDINIPELLYCRDKNNNNCIGMRCRRVGMIVRYDMNSNFMNGIKLDNDQEYLFTFLRINDAAVVTDRNHHAIVSLDEYVRRCEPPAHDDWKDMDVSKIDFDSESFTPKIIEKLIRNTRDQLQNEYRKKVEREKGRRLGMSRAVGRLLFPDGFFDISNVQTQTRKTSSASGRKTTQFSSHGDGTVYEDDTISFTTKVTLGKNHDLFSIRMAPSIRGENIDSVEEWESKTNSPFPYKILEAEITSLNSKIQSPPINVTHGQNQMNNVIITALTHGVDSIIDEFRIKKDDDALELNLRLTIKRGKAFFPIRIIITEVGDGE